jgi:hypothetical protein
MKPPWIINVHLKRIEGQEGKTGLFQGWARGIGEGIRKD